MNLSALNEPQCTSWPARAQKLSSPRKIIPPEEGFHGDQNKLAMFSWNSCSVTLVTVAFMGWYRDILIIRTQRNKTTPPEEERKVIITQKTEAQSHVYVFGRWNHLRGWRTSSCWVLTSWSGWARRRPALRCGSRWPAPSPAGTPPGPCCPWCGTPPAGPSRGTRSLPWPETETRSLTTNKHGLQRNTNKAVPRVATKCCTYILLIIVITVHIINQIYFSSWGNPGKWTLLQLANDSINIYTLFSWYQRFCRDVHGRISGHSFQVKVAVIKPEPGQHLVVFLSGVLKIYGPAFQRPNRPAPPQSPL